MYCSTAFQGFPLKVGGLIEVYNFNNSHHIEIVTGSHNLANSWNSSASP